MNFVVWSLLLLELEVLRGEEAFGKADLELYLQFSFNKGYVSDASPTALALGSGLGAN